MKQLFTSLQSCSLVENRVQLVSLDMSDWILLWQMVENVEVNVFPTACSAAAPQEASSEVNK